MSVKIREEKDGNVIDHMFGYNDAITNKRYMRISQMVEEHGSIPNVCAAGQDVAVEFVSLFLVGNHSAVTWENAYMVDVRDAFTGFFSALKPASQG